MSGKHAGKMPKELVFGWCQTDKHEDCRKKYGDNIICICNCGPRHGTNRKASQEESDRQVAEITARLNQYGKDGGRPSREDYGYKPGYIIKKHEDAATIEELEQRRLAK